MSGAGQDWGKVVHAEEQYVQKTDNVEVLKIYKNKTDGQWYYKNYLNQSFPFFNSSSNTKTYKAAFSLVSTVIGDGQPIAHIIQNDLGFIPTWQRVGVGTYVSFMPEWADKVDKIFISSTKCPLTGAGYINCGYSSNDSGIILLTRDKFGDLKDGLLSDSNEFSRSYIEITLKD